MYSSNVEKVENVDTGSTNTCINNDSVGNLQAAECNTNSNTISSKEPRIQTLSKSFCKKMLILLRELCFLTIVFVTYASFQNNTPKVSKIPNAFPFFAPGTVVKDWYRGQLTEAINLATESDLAFIMYYAPWDAESQAVRQEFNIVSQHMHKYVHFAAINCWHPGSECNSQYSKVYSWPVLMAYPTHGRGIQYKGPRKAEHMMKFLQLIIQPFIRIKSTREINRYRAQYDAVVVGYVDAKLGSEQYGVLYSTALRFIERDPLKEIQFLILTGDNQKSIPTPSLELVMWNETLMYPVSFGWKPDLMVAWIFDNLHQVSVWASPTGTKSHYLTSFVQPGPALILFTPRNPLYELTDYYTTLHEVAMEYYDCDDNLAIEFQKMILLAIRGTTEDLYWKHKRLLKKCSVNEKSKKTEDVPVVTYDVSKLLLNNTCSASDVDSICLNLSKDKNKCNKMFNMHPQQKINLRTTSKDEEIFSRESKIETKEDAPWISMFTGNGDYLSPENLQYLADIEKCRYLRIAHRIQPAIFTPRIQKSEELNDTVSGMACKTNMSLALVALDSLQNYYFAESLGIDILKEKDKTAVVILNPKYETHHIMMKPYNSTNLRSFIRNFANGNLERVVRSSVATHHQKQTEKHKISSQTSIVELTTSTFLPTVMQLDQVIVILYHSIKCAFCSGIAHILLTISRLLSSVTKLQFARIDGDDHALPWEYSMHHYPTILFFPAQKKSESRAFPHNVPITVPNLLSFILANVDSEMKIHIIWTLCQQSKYEQDLQACARTLRLESTSLVGKLLREYRSSSNPRQSAAVFKRLQHIRLLQFLFTSPVKLNSAIIQQHLSMLYIGSPNETNYKDKKL